MHCPDCAAALTEAEPLGCSACAWQGERKGGIPVYLSKRDREDPVLKEYLENYDRICADDLEKSIQDECYVNNQAMNLADLVSLSPDDTVCDLGVGKGYLANALLKRGARQLTIVDISLGYLQPLASNPQIVPVLANAENLPFGRTFDAVVATDILEHVMNVGSFLYSLNRSLKPGGRVYVRVPYNESLLRYSPHLGCPYRFVHLRTFDKRILRGHLEAAGFVIEKFHFDGYWFTIPHAFWAKGFLRPYILGKIIKWAKERVSHYTDITRWNSWLVGLFLKPVEVTVVAHKVKEIAILADGGYQLEDC